MALMLQKQRDGSLRKNWYGVYVEPRGDGEGRGKGKRRVVNLNVPLKGTPPLSGKVADKGDEAFEASRIRAEEALARFAEEAKHRGRDERLLERLHASKTGEAVQYHRIADLPALWRQESTGGEKHLSANCDPLFRCFGEFMRERNPGAEFLHDVTKADAAAFADRICGEKSTTTANRQIGYLNSAFAMFLPGANGNRNNTPFSPFVGKRSKKKNGKEKGGEIHRKPFSSDELRAILDTARKDDFMFPLIVAAACTGMRKGDVCCLQWFAVDMKGGMLDVKTSKTGERVEIPIFPPLMQVLQERGGKRSGYVFPEAARMYERDDKGLTRQFKKIIVEALAGETPAIQEKTVEASKVKREALAAIREHVPEGKRRERMTEAFTLYAAGESVRAIQQELGVARSTVSKDLNEIVAWTGKNFLRRTPGRHSGGVSMTASIARLTREERAQGVNAASVRDWHTMRTTFVTLALTAGIPAELVQRVTGHKTVAVVMEHYFRPDREQFKAAFSDALPDVLTGGGEVLDVEYEEVKPEADELVKLAQRIADCTATGKERKRFKELAGNV